MFLEQLENRSLLAVMVWDGSANNLWSNAANWVGDVAPMAGDDLVFPAAAGNLANSNDLAVGTRFNTILLQGSGYNITGAAIELSGGLTANNSTGSNTFGLNTTLGNAQTFMSANAGTTLNVTGSINTGNIVGSYFVGSVPAIVFDGQGDLNASGVISGAGGLSKLGGGTLTLGGNNTFEGIAEARQGFIRVTHNNGLGSATTAHTEVQAGAALELSGVTTAENFAIREGGVGFGNGTDISSAGALRAVGGTTSTVTGNVEMIGGNNLIGVAAGASLNISGQILAGLSTGTGRRLLKVGPGSLEISGNQPNVYPGDTIVLQGRLDLNKTPNTTAIPGNLIIGDNIGGDNAAEVRLLGSNQIAQLNLFDVVINTITLNSSGVLNFNGNSDVIGNLVLTTGNTYSSDVTTGAGTMTLGGNLTLSTFQGSSGATPAATISGNLNLGTFFSGGAAGSGQGTSRTFNIGDTQLQHIGTDLLISANITSTSDIAITHTGVGTLQLSGNNSGWNGPYIMQGGGVLELASNTALGGGLVSLQNNSNVVRAIGVSRTINNPLSLDGNVTFLGDDNTPGVENLTFTGNATLTGDRTLLTMDPTQNVTFSGVIDEGIFASRSLAKSGRGVLTLTNANTYSGTTTVNSDSGNLVLSGNGSLLNNGNLVIGISSTLTLDNTGTVLNNRIDDARSISMAGRLLLRGNAAANVQELVGPVDTNGEQAPILEVENVSGGAFSSVLVANTLTVAGNRPTRFVGNGVPLSESGQNRIEITLAPGGIDDGILAQGVVVSPSGALDFATFGSGPNGTAIFALPASAYVTDLAQASATSNVRLSGAQAITGNKIVNAILFEDDATLSGPAGSALTVGTGNLLFRGDGAVSVPSLSLGAGINGVFFVDTGFTATVSSNIFLGSILKNGFGKLIISGDNQHTGSTGAGEGVLNIQRSTAVGSPTGATYARANATLEIEQTTFGPVTVGLEALSADGTGGPANAGAIRNVAGNNSWAGTVTVNGVSANLLAATGGFPLSNVSIPFVRTETGSRLTITGDFPGAAELAKTGGGTLELAGIISRGTDRNNRVLEGTMLLNNEPGIQASRGRYFIGSNAVGAPAATVRLGGSDQIIDDRGVTVFGSGFFDVNGFNELIGEGLTTHISPAGAGDVNIGAGGTLTVNANTQVFTQGTGNAAGSTITGGTFALQAFGVIGGALARTLQINEGAVGNDLTITSAIVDGTGLQSFGITKSGFGQLEFGGAAPNTFTGDTTVSEGTLILNKGTGAGGVDALAGRVLIGDNNVTNGFASSDIVRLAQPNQIPDFLALVDVRMTGLFDLNGNYESIGVADVQNALTMQAGSTVNLGAATLNLVGNIGTAANNGAATLWTPVVAPRIVGGTLGLGTLPRNIDVGGDQGTLPYELEITSNLTGASGFLLANTGTLLLSGDNSGLTGDVVRTNGNFALGSDTALGSGRALLNGIITTYGGKRTIATEIVFGANTIGYISGNNTAGVGAIGGGGNDLEFSGPVNVTAGTWQPSVSNAGQLTFSGGLGETLGSVFTRKLGFGTMIISSVSTLGGNVEIGQASGDVTGAFVRANGGTLVLRDSGTWVNGQFLVGYGSTLQIDNSGTALPHRVGDTGNIDMSGGTLALVGKAGVPVGESFGTLNLRENSKSSMVHALLPAAPGSTATWRFTNYNLANVVQGSSVQFVGRGADLTTTGANRIAFNATPALTDGIIQTAVMSGSGEFDFATVTNGTPTLTPFDNFLGALTTGPNFGTTLAGATATTNVKLSASEVVAGAVSANALLLANGGITVSGAGSLALDASMVASRGVGNAISVATLTGATNTVVYVDGPNSTLTISSNIAGAATSLAKGGTGLLNLSGNNTFTGATRVTDGVLRASSNTAFGTTAGNVVVPYGGTVELNGVNIPAEQIFFGGFGEFNLAAVGVRALAGTTNTWNGVFQMDNNRSAVEVGALGRLTIVGQLNSGNGLNKTGEGALEFQGGANNATGAIQLWQGTLELNKTPGSNAANGTITIGDNVGGPNADRVVLLNNDQIQNTNNITVTSTGVFDYGTFNDTINAFSIQAGLVASGTITGTGALSIVNNSSIDGLQSSGAGGSFGPATIAGTFVLGGTAPRILTVNDTVGLLDVNMPAVLGAASVNFQKDGAGRLALSGNSSAYAGSITLNGGETVVQHANALGTVGGNTTVNANISLLLDGVSLAEPLSLNGVGFGGPGAIRNISGNNSLTGGITLAGTATIGVNAGQTLDVNSQITGAGQGVTKLLPGTLRYSGGTANNYTGTTSVFEGVLELNKNIGVDAIAGILTVGNDAGPQDSDLVRLLTADQINNGVQVQVSPSGRLDLNNLNETLGNAAQAGLNFFAGVTTFPRVTTGTGTLTLNTGVGIQVQSLAGGIAAATTASPGATISGILALNNVAHNINAVDSGLNIRELQIDATIVGGGAAGTLSTSGTGLTYITGNNTGLTGTTTINGGGGFVVGNNNALGTGTINIAAVSNLFTAGYGAPAGSSTFTLPNPITLNADLVVRGDQNLVLNGLVSGIGAANRTVTLNTHNNAAFTIGTGGISLSNDGTARTFTLTNNTFNHTAALVSGPIANGTGAANHAFQKAGVGWLTLSNNANSFAGVTTVAGGILQVTAAGALGTNGSISANQTTVNNGATLVVAPGVTLPEWLVLNNNGFGNFGALRLLDTVPGTTQTATISGNVNFAATAFVGVDGGGANPDRLIFTGSLASGSGQTQKVGLGEMEVAGAGDNGVTFTGAPSPFDDGLLVRQGSWIFNKTGALRGIAGGTITVGDGGGGSNSARLILIGSGTDQIGGNLNLDINANGQFSFAGATTSESIAQLQMFRLGSAAGNTNTTGAGTLILNGNIFASNAGLTTAASPPAVVAGNINLNGGRNVNASDSFVLDPAEDLLISALISNGSINVNGDGLRSGTVALTGANTYAGGTTVTGQTIDFNQSFTHGLNVFVAGTLVLRDGGVAGTGNVTVQAGATLMLDNTTANANRIADTATVTMNAGNLFLIGNAAGSNETITTFTLNSGNNAGQDNRVTIDSTAGGLTVLQTTNLTRGGSGTAHFIGVGADLGNATTSQINITAGTNPFVNTVIPWATISGPAGYDLVTDGDGAPATAPYFIGRVLSYSTSVNSGGIVRLNGGTDTLTADRTVDALLLENGATINGPFTLTVGTATAGLVVTRTGNNSIATTGSGTNPALQFAGREPLYLTEAGSSLSITGTINSTNTSRKERGGDLILSGDNDVAAGRQLTGAFNINAGTVTAAHEDAFGTEPGGVVSVFRRAALIIDATAGPVNFGNKALTVGGLGVNDNGTGALRTVGANTVTVGTGATLINWGANPTIVNNTGVLDLNAVVANAANNPMIKRGPGELIYRGNPNTNTNTVTVNEGTLTLNKPVGPAVRGALTINDLGNYDDAGAGIVQYGPAAGADQIGNNETQTITAPAAITTFTLTFNGFTTGLLTRATAAGIDVQTALEALPSIGSGNVSVSGVAGGPYIVTFTGLLAHLNVAALTGAATGGTLAFASVDGGVVNVVVNANGTLALNGNSETINTLTVNGGVVNSGGGNLTTTGAITITGGSIATGAGSLIISNNEVQTISVPASITTFTLSFGGFTTGNITTATATGAIVQAALEVLTSIGPGNVSVFGAAGGPYTVTFTGVLGGLDVAQLTGTTTGGTGTITFATLFGGANAITFNAGLATNGSATISGNLNLNGASRAIVVSDQYQANNDLTIDAAISNGRLLKSGAGALLLSNAANSFQTDVNQVQTITVNAGVTSFTLTANIFAALTTVSIPYSAATPASNIQFALERLANIQPGNVSVTGPLGGPYTVTFQGALSGFNFAQLTSTPVGGTITHATPTIGAHSIQVTGGTLAFSSDTALGSQRVIMNGNDTLLPVGGNRNIANPISFFPNQTHVLGGRRDFTGTNGLTLSGPVSLFTPAVAQDLNLQVDDPLTNVIISGVLGGGNSTGFLRLQKTGQGTLQLTGSNTFVAPLNIAAGIVRVANSDGLGLRTNELVFVQDTGAAYTLAFNGFTTTSIPTGSSAATVAARLNELPSIGGVNGSVTVTGTGLVNATTFDPFIIEFRDSLAGTDVALTATGATIMAITRNGAGTTVNANTALELQGNLALGDEFITFVGVGALPRTGTSAGFTGAIRALSGNSTIGSGKTPIQSGGGNGQVNYIGVDAGASLVLNGSVFQPVALPATQFTNLNKVGQGILEYQGTTPNTYGTTGVLNGILRLNKAPGVNAIPLTIGVSTTVVVGDNVGAANSDQLILVQAEQIPDGSAVTVAGTGQVMAIASQAVSVNNEVQQVTIGNAAPAGQYRLQFNGVSTADIGFGVGLGVIQAALNALSTIGGVGGSVVVQGSGSGQNQFYTITFLGSLAGANQPQIKVVAGTTPYSVATVAVTTVTLGGVTGRETVGATTLRIAPQGAGNISLQGGSTLALTADVTVDNYGALPATALIGAAITGGTLDLRQTSANGATINRNFNVNADAPAIDDLTITSQLVDGAYGAVANVNKAGAANSRLVLSGTNSFSGQVVVSNGALAITNSLALGSIRTDEVQSYVINNVLGNASGTYTITTDQGVTVPLSVNASADEVQVALEAIYGAGNVRVVSTINGNTNVQYFIHWLPGARADFPITRFTPTLTTTTTAAISYPTDVTLDAANGAGGGTTNFEGLWSGFVTVAPADPLTWSFGTNSDDGSIILIDLNNDGLYTPEERIVNNLGFHGAIAFTSNVTFPAAGNYRIAIGFMQATGGGSMEARFAKAANATYAEQANINPGLAAQVGIWSDDFSVPNQLTVDWFNRVPTASGADLDPSIQPIVLTNINLANASLGAVTTHQEGGQQAGTNVAAAAALELQGGAGMTIVNEPLTLNGVGILNAPTRGLWNNAFQGAVGTGNLRNVTGDNVWQGNLSGFGNISLANNITAAIGVDGGSLTSNGTTGNISNVLVTAGSLIKTGPGVLETAGSAANQYTGNTSVQQGTYRLNKTGNQPAIPGGEIIVGDSIGGDNADVLVYAPTAGGDQIVNRIIRIASSGLLNLNNITDTNNNTIVLDVGPTFSADVSTGTGVLINNNQFTVVSQAGTTLASVPAAISGIYDLNAGTRNVEVREGNALVELDIQARIQGGAVGINKTARGTLAISGNNTYTGTTTVNGDSGTLLANTPSTVAVSPYVVGTGSTLGGTGFITGAVTVNGVGASLTIGGIINPGPNAPAPGNTGILTVNNNVSFGAGAQLQADINGTTVGTQYDQLVVGGTGTVTTTGNAVPNINNTSTINGTTGNGFQPVNGVDSFKLINKTSAGAITVGVNSFLSQVLPQPPQTSPTTVVLGGKTYSTSYNTVLGINDGNDFVLQAVPTVRVWDGRVDNSIVNVSDSLMLNTNWVGDITPFAGDDLSFSDVGISNGKTTPVNDFAAGFDFRSINFTNTSGSYTVTGNNVLLNVLSGGVTSDNLTNVPVTNSLNIPLTTGVNPQSITVKDGSTLNLGGAISIGATGPLTVTNGVGVDANGTAVFGGNVNGASILTINMIGDATFNGVIGGVTPLTNITVTTVDDLTFNNTIAATTVSQAAGTGLTTLSGGNVGTLTMTNEAFTLGGTALNVTGATTLTATVGSIGDSNGAANNLTGPSLTATAITGINLDTTIVDLTASNTGAGNVSIDDANALNILGLSVANGNAVISAGGALTDGATAVTSVSGNGSFGGSTVTLGDAVGDSFNLGSLTFTSTGLVTITEDSNLQLGGTSSAPNAILNSPVSITNAAGANVGVSGNAAFVSPSVTLGNQLGDLLNFGTLSFTSAGIVNISEDSAMQLAGTSTANSLLLTSAGLLDNAVGASVTVTNNASFAAPNIALGGAAGDSLNFGTLTFAATAGTATIAEDSSLDLAGASTATLAINLTSVDVAAAGQNFNLPLGASLQSTTSSVTLNAGDDALIAGTITSALATTINVDAGDAETPANPELVAGSGGTLAITGVINTPAVGSGGGAFLNGNEDFDTFNLSPQTTTEFRINGNLPVAQITGDVLVLDVTGTTTPSLTVPGSIAPYTGPGSGAWSFTSAHRPVLFTSIEDTTTVGNYHLTYDNSTAPVGNLFVMRDAAQTRLQLRAGSNAGPVLFQGLLTPIQSLRILGSAGNDIVTVDDINTLPNFAGTVPGVTNNANIAGTGEFLFDGLGGSDTLVYQLTGATASQTYAIGNGTGSAGLEGEIESIAAGINLLSYFQNVELTQRTGVGATPGGLSILGDSSGNTFATTANDPFTRTTATGYTPFEFSGNNYSGFSVNGGLGGDTIDLQGIGDGQIGPLATTFNGDSGADTLRVQGTSGNTGTVTLFGGVGDDLFQLFNTSNTVDNIAGPIVVDGTDGNVGGNTDTLVIDDRGDATADTVFVNAVNPGVSDDYRVEGINGAGGNDVTFRNIDTLDYTGTQGNDAIDARFVNTTPLQHDLTTVSLSGWLGADQFYLFTSDQIGGSGPGVTPTGTASGLANIRLYGDAPGNPNLTDGNDIFGETPAAPFTGTGIMNVGLLVPDTTRMIRPSASTSIAIDGGQPTGLAAPLGDVPGDVHNLDISALPNATSVIVSTFGPGTVVAPGIQSLTWTQIEDINLVDQGRLTNVQMGDLFARTTPNPDLVQITRDPTLTNPNQLRLRISATIGSYSATNKTIIYGGGGNDTITQANMTIPAEFYGEDGNDNLSGAMNNDWLVGGLGNDRINASGGDNVVWGDNAPTSDNPNPQDTGIGGNDTLSALGGNDVFYAGAGNDTVSAGAGDDYANGGQGNDVLDGFDGHDRLYGGAGNDVIGGHAGNDLLSGGDGDDKLFGGDGNDVIFGGTGADEINGGSGNDLLVTGSVANENSIRTSVASVSNYSPATYTDGLDNDAALLILLGNWASFSNRGTLGTNPAITHDGVDDDVFGSLGDDDFCWEAADIADDFPAVAPPDYNAFGMGTDERFGPT